MPFVHKETGKRITGVETRLERIESIEPGKVKAWKPYSHNRCWPIVKDSAGKAVMAIEGGGSCTEDEMEWRDDTGRA